MRATLIYLLEFYLLLMGSPFIENFFKLFKDNFLWLLGTH
uniref:Uncharacterized protein n=1 Tax=Myoviridae sp. ct3Pt8 TaxID=2826608 RepID=A0A8S5MM44_9CAUD|nr:MAG TPA: hypothetical protein [Myoviridae sp. ct3Pt8]